jgi:hypothetical protein
MLNRYSNKGIRYNAIWNKFFHIPYTSIPLYLLLLFPISGISAQPETNLDIFYKIVDSSASEFISQIPESEDSVKLELNLGESYSVFGNKVVATLFSSGKIVANDSKDVIKINYIIDDANVKYGEIFRDGFFGDYFVPRNLNIKGNYLIYTNSALYKEFNFSFTDTVRYDEIKSVENISFPFTQGKVPAEPFFSGLFEPIVAVGTAALAVILFFTIRSK